MVLRLLYSPEAMLCLRPWLREHPHDFERGLVKLWKSKMRRNGIECNGVLLRTVLQGSIRGGGYMMGALHNS